MPVTTRSYSERSSANHPVLDARDARGRASSRRQAPDADLRETATQTGRESGASICDGTTCPTQRRCRASSWASTVDSRVLVPRSPPLLSQRFRGDLRDSVARIAALDAANISASRSPVAVMDELQVSPVRRVPSAIFRASRSCACCPTVASPRSGGCRRPGRSARPRASTGDAYDNALADSFVDSFKTELIRDRVWKTRTQLELAVVEWVGWYNHDRLHSALGHIPQRNSKASTLEQDDASPSLIMHGDSK